LYYQDGQDIVRLSVGRSPRAGTHLVDAGNVGLVGMAFTATDMYWTENTDKNTDRAGVLMQSSRDGSGAHPLVADIPFPDGLVVVGGYLYWLDEDAIGRVRVDGKDLRRRYIKLHRERGLGSVGEGLATDGQALYVARCEEGAILQISLGTPLRTTRLVEIPGACPQAIAVGVGYVYWAELGGMPDGSGAIGRVALSGRDADPTWLSIRSNQGPFHVAVDGQYVYWEWGGGAGAPPYIGRAAVAAAHRMTRRFVQGQTPVLLK